MDQQLHDACCPRVMVRTHNTAAVPAAMVLQASQLDPASGVLRVRLTVAGAWLLHLLASSPGQVLTYTLHQAPARDTHTSTFT